MRVFGAEAWNFDAIPMGLRVIMALVISIILSVVMFLFPVLVNNAVVTVIGVGMVLVSVFLILWGIKMLSFEKKVFEKSHQESETDWEEL